MLYASLRRHRDVFHGDLDSANPVKVENPAVPTVLSLNTRALQKEEAGIWVLAPGHVAQQYVQWMDALHWE